MSDRTNDDEISGRPRAGTNSARTPKNSSNGVDLGSIASAAKQEAFARELLKGTNQSAAYREVFPQSRKWKDKTVHEKASRLAGKVRARVEQLKEEAANAAKLDRAWVLNQLHKVVARCMQIKPVYVSVQPTGEYVFNAMGANKALELLGKELGMFVERRENTNAVYHISDEPMTEDEWAERFASGPQNVRH